MPPIALAVASAKPPLLVLSAWAFAPAAMSRIAGTSAYTTIAAGGREYSGHILGSGEIDRAGCRAAAAGVADAETIAAAAAGCGYFRLRNRRTPGFEAVRNELAVPAVPAVPSKEAPAAPPTAV